LSGFTAGFFGSGAESTFTTGSSTCGRSTCSLTLAPMIGMSSFDVPHAVKVNAITAVAATARKYFMAFPFVVRRL
jgi:hypothetical protein